MTISRTFQWYRHATADPTASPATISGATGQSYTSVVGDVGKYLHLKETATNSAGSATATSNVVGPVAAAGTTFTPETGTVAPIETMFGGRPVQPLVKPWWELDIINSEGQNAEAQHAIMCAGGPLYTETVRSGRWSDPTTWSNGVPQTGGSACIEEGFSVIYDVYMTTALKYLTVHGSFRVDTTIDTKLIVDSIHSHYGSYFEIGTKASPCPESSVVESNGKRRPRFNCVFIGDAPGSSTRLGAMWMGEVQIWGADKKEKINVADISAGATSFTASTAADVAGWLIGDEIEFLSRSTFSGRYIDTTYKGPWGYRVIGAAWGEAARPAAPTYGYPGSKVSHDERRVITAINYTTGVVSWSGGLTYDHKTLTSTRSFKDGSKAVLPARVCNLSRSISFSSGGDISDHQQRGHSMFMHCDRVQCHSAMFVDMGRTDIRPDMVGAVSIDPGYSGEGLFDYATGTIPIAQDPNNVRGRYPVHVHGTGRDFGRYQVIVNKVVSKASQVGPTSIPIPGWAFTHHNSRASFNHCIGSNFRGGGMVSEAGTEIGQWVGNTMIWGRGHGMLTHSYTMERTQNRQAGQGVAYDLQSRNILMRDNEFTSCVYGLDNQSARAPGLDIEASADHTAMRLFHPTSGGDARRGMGVGAWTWGADKYGDQQAQFPAWDGFFGCDFDTMFFVGNRDYIVDKSDRTPGVFTNWIAYGGNCFCNIISYSWWYHWRRFAMFGMNGGVAFMCGPRAMGLNWNDGLIEGSGAFIDYSQVNARSISADKTTGFIIDVDMAFGNPDATWFTLASSSSYTHVNPAFALATGDPTKYYETRDLTLDYYEYRMTENGVASGDYSASKGAINFVGQITDTFGTYTWPRMFNDTLGNNQMFSSEVPERIVQRNGCFQVGGVWKTRLHFQDVDRLTLDWFQFYQDVTLVNFPSAVLAANDLGSPPAAQITTTNPVTGKIDLLPESINKPFAPALAPVNTVAPWISGVAMVGEGVFANVGAWAAKPNDVDGFEYQWFRNGVAIASGSRRYTLTSADVGQSLTCEVTGVNVGGRTTVATPAFVAQAAVQTPSQIFGTALIDFWRADLQPMTYKKADGSVNPGVAVRDQSGAGLWQGEKGTIWAGHVDSGWAKFDADEPNYEYEGWSGKPCVYFPGITAYTKGRHQMYRSVANPHFWIVAERPAAQESGALTYDGGRKTIVSVGGSFRIWMLNPEQDSAQTILGSDIGNRTDFGPGARKVLYAGRDATGRKVSVDNAAMQTDASGSGGSGPFWISLGGETEMARLRVRAVVMVDAASVSSAQYAAIQTYLSNFL